MKERLKKLRKALDLTQQEFADRIGISRGNIATYETRNGAPGNSVINLICREFSVNETWLRTGEGEMFAPKEMDAWEEVVQRRGLSNSDRLLIEKFMNLKPSEREVVMKYVLSVAAEYSSVVATSGPVGQKWAGKQKAEKQKMPTPGDGDGLEAQKKQLMEYLDMMNPGQLQMYYDQMRKLKKPQREASPLSAPAEADKNAPGFDPSDLA